MSSPDGAPTWLTADLLATGGHFKVHPEDFRVEEVPLYPFVGEGEHLLLQVEKRGITTHEVAARLARALGVGERDVGYAGIKDARAVAVQWFSVLDRGAGDQKNLDQVGLRVLERTRHRNKLKPGHLAGNRFEIRLRDTVPQALARARAILDVLGKRGVPNAFGPQRFGTKGDGDRIGRALLHEDFDGALRWYLGAPSPRERNPRIREARRLFHEGHPEQARRTWPDRMRVERRVLTAWLRRRDARAALAKIPKSLRLLFLSAYQSRLFNRCLAQRLATLDHLLEGDVAVKHVNGAAFRVEDPQREAPRVEAFEISPAGALFGPGLLRPHGEAAAVEDAVFAAEDLDPERSGSPFRDVHLRGERRPYRFPLLDPDVEEIPGGLDVRFRLPRGCYATSVIGELTRDEELAAIEPTDEESSSDEP